MDPDFIKRLEEIETLRINYIVASLRITAGKLGKHQVLFPGVEIVDKTELYAMLLGGSDPDSGNTLEVSGLLRYIADMMEI